MPAAATAAAVSILTVTGEEHSGTLVAIDAEQIHLSSGDSKTELATPDVRSIRFASSTAAPAGAESLILACGTVLSGEAIELTDNEDIAIKLALGGNAAFPIDAVRGIRLQPKRNDSLFERGLTGEGDPENDRVYVPQGPELRELSGILDSMTTSEVVLDRDGVPVELARDKVHGILFANAIEPNLDGLNAVITVAGGSRIRCSITGFSSDSLQLQMVEGVELALRASHVESIRLQPPNLVYVSDLEPEAAVVQPLLAPQREWQRDLSVAGTPLQLGSRTFEKGLGTAAGTELTYQNTDQFAKFTALVGIDPARGKRGDCEVVVSADGRELERHRIKGGGEPVSLHVDVASASTIVLSVEPGEDYDLSDHVNWCDAAFLKK